MADTDSTPDLLNVSSTSSTAEDYNVTDLCTRMDKIESVLKITTNILSKYQRDLKAVHVNNITVSQLERKYSKSEMADQLMVMARYLDYNVEELKSNRKLLTQFQTWTIKSQDEKLKLQNDVIKCQDKQLEDFKTTMTSEVKTWSEVLTKNIPQQTSNVTFSPRAIESAVKKVVLDDDRSKNLMVYGIDEADNEDIDKVVTDVFSVLGEKPRVVERRRIGAHKSDRSRPIKITLTSGDIVQQILRKSGSLKKSVNHRTTFIEVDRSITERAEHRKLVTLLKEKIESDPGQFHCIRQNKIVSLKRSDEGA